MGFNLFGRDRETEEKLDQISIDVAPGEEWRKDIGKSDDTSNEPQVSISDRLDNMMANQGFAANIKASLRKADLKFTVAEYLALHLIVFIVVGAIMFLWRGPLGIGIGALAGFFGPRVYVSSRKNKRLKGFNDQLADILGLWVNALRAGYSVTQAMEAVSREAPPPANEEFKRIVAEIAIGIPMEIALNNMLSRIPSEDLDLVFTAVNIQREVGGNLAEILDVISDTIRQRVRIKGEIRVLTSSGRATGSLISGLPIILALFLLLINPVYMGQLFFGPPRGAFIPLTRIPCGYPLIAAALVLIAIGNAIIRKIVDVQI